MVDVLLGRRGKTSRPCRELAPQLVPFPTGVKRNFEQCSPSPSATARQGHATRRRSQPLQHPLSVLFVGQSGYSRTPKAKTPLSLYLKLFDLLEVLRCRSWMSLWNMSSVMGFKSWVRSWS